MQRKTPNFAELAAIVDDLDIVVGTELQSVKLQGSSFYFGFYPGEPVTIAVDLNPGQPFFCRLTRDGVGKTREKKPVSTFAQTHLKGAQLTELSVVEEYGRVVRMVFDRGEVEIRLVPRAPNLIVRAADKVVSWKKVLEMSPIDPNLKFDIERSPQQMSELWESKPKPKAVKDEKSHREKKWKNAIRKIQSDIDKKREKKFAQAADWVKNHWSLEVPADLSEYIDSDLSIADNVRVLFEKSRTNEEKIRSAEERMRELQKSLKALEHEKVVAPVPSLLKQAGVKGRTLELPSGMSAVCGKNARDNLQLLRKAKSWDLWLHLKDYPGSHAIVRRNKNQAVEDKTLRDVAQWLIEQSVRKRTPGEVFDVIYAECRYVKPIKGSPGQVTYSNVQSMGVKVVK